MLAAHTGRDGLFGRYRPDVYFGKGETTDGEMEGRLNSLLLAEGLCLHAGGGWRLTPEGMAYSDAIGPAFISEEVKLRMKGWKRY